MRIMALDVGDKTIGVAVTDPMGWTAQGVDVIRRSGLKKDLDGIMKYIKEYSVEKIVVGLPLDSDGRIGPQAKKVLAFQKKLGHFLDDGGLSVCLETWDESMTTIEAEEFLVGAGVSRAGRKKIIDKMAAVMILKSYLESKSA